MGNGRDHFTCVDFADGFQITIGEFCRGRHTRKISLINIHPSEMGQGGGLPVAAAEGHSWQCGAQALA